MLISVAPAARVISPFSWHRPRGLRDRHSFRSQVGYGEVLRGTGGSDIFDFEDHEPVDLVFPLSQASAAFARSMERDTRGKVTLKVSDD